MAYLGPPPSQKLATPTSQYFSGNGSTTAFTLNRPVNVAEDLNVFVNNVPQEPGSGKSYTATGTTLTFDAAPASGTNNVYVVYRGLAEPTTRLEHPSNQPLAATTGTFSGNVSTTPGSVSIKAINGGYTGGLLIEDDSNTTKSAITHVVGTLAISANASADHMLIDSSGRTTIPNQPLFVATSPIEGTSGAEPATSVRYKRWNSIVFNIGSNFDNASGAGFFTAPVAGRYYIMFKAGHKITYNQWCGMYLYKNSTNICVFWDEPDTSTSGVYNANNASIILSLAANDTCGVGYHTNYSDLSANSNNFISIGLLH